ncbi:MAG: aminoacyl-histidine dipeptidase [Candidatus Riflebacteria bacterium]|nr:aminoacyl-histidine dipeptidase [Candidatus Riflebacteria bacterium]
MAKKKIDNTEHILDLFEQVSAIPRPSKHEERICEWLMEWASKQGFTARQDEIGNILIEVPGTKGYEDSSPVILQGHLDMVCEKNPESTHDFSKDPIRFVRDGDWLHADGTSLGADNGLAIAMAMAAATDPTLKRPPLELLFTVDEETGLSGAQGLKADFFKGRTMINLDSEDEGRFTVGCAGGRETEISLPLSWNEVPADWQALSLKADGMVGGHSGVNIHEGRANAIRILARTLFMISEHAPICIAGIRGGTAHNAIPRAAMAVFYVETSKVYEVRKLADEAHHIFRDEFKTTDPNLTILCDPFEDAPDRRAMTQGSSNRLLDLLIAMPHGVAAMSTAVQGLVETSNNQAMVQIEEGKLSITSSQRSSVMTRLDGITRKVEAVARLAGATFKTNVGYPAWQPDMSSPLLAEAKTLYKKLFKQEAHIELIHAGLECGLIGAIKPGMDMISMGATMRDPHSPSERLFVPSIAKIWDLMVEILKILK